MNGLTDRRGFVVATAGVAGMAGVLGVVGVPRVVRGGAVGSKSPAFPKQDAEQAKKIVGRSHFDLEFVKKHVEAQPELAKSAIDWGFGDWESALGAASHTGRREIAEVLMAYGARPDIFTFAMLGSVDVVRAYVEARPGIQRTFGPHGISLLRHAKAGGDEASLVHEYLEELGDAGDGQTNLSIAADEMATFLGSYVFGLGASERFTIIEKKGTLAIQPGGEFPWRGLARQGPVEFCPAGADSVRLRFEVTNKLAVGVEITGLAERIHAERESG